MITGTVLDEHGSPVAKAKALITEKGVFAAHRVLQFHETDADGHFRTALVPWGTYIVTVGKEAAGYADTGFGLHCNNAYPTVVLTEDSPTADVTVKLGPKAGVLELEPATDSATGNVIRLAAIRLKCAENPDLFIFTSASEGRFLIPPLTDVLIEISAEGYRSWPAPGLETTEGRAFLKPEQIHKLQVTLQPEERVPPDGRK
ncbi:MAG TPA: carboxypeptidase-like regulatory domain-containing protein [Candidatus Sulfotelmatobacter sp.]